MIKIFKKSSFFALIAIFVLAPSVSSAQIISVESISVSSGEVLGDGLSVSAGMTPDARYVILASLSTNLVAGDTNDSIDIFLRDRTLGTT